MFKARRTARRLASQAPQAPQALQAAQAATAASLSRASAGTLRLPSIQGTLDMTVVRPGRYVMTDRLGRQVGEVQGDYVIGFRAHYQGQQRSFTTLEQARAHVEQHWLGQQSTMAS
jgi:D-serine deaminase-like pyridoxal phosphate-dependent protein